MLANSKTTTTSLYITDPAPPNHAIIYLSKYLELNDYEPRESAR